MLEQAAWRQHARGHTRHFALAVLVLLDVISAQLNYVHRTEYSHDGPTEYVQRGRQQTPFPRRAFTEDFATPARSGKLSGHMRPGETMRWGQQRLNSRGL